ncbi:Hypothetical predicted protein [Olea europaea subsp. europaea]|uniref:Uncharacterized protein n=1 Tax=Olea europaea subsp. europaea TaxID=158383 RepID=A0A8S0QF81_OLEEU|nr:Hypothetical predicted protein [Olea europaea subsp. europaea]
MSGTRAHFLAFLGSFWDKVCRPCQGCKHVFGHFWDTMRRPCPGRGQISRHFLAVYSTLCASHVQDASWPWWGRRPFFKHTKVARRASHVRDVSMFSGIFGTRCSGHVQAGRILAIDTVCRPYPGRDWATTRIQPDFQAFLGSFWARYVSHVGDASSVQQGRGLISKHFYTVSGTRCAVHVHGTARTRSDFQAFLGSFWNTIYRPCSGHVPAKAWMQANF